MSKVPLVVSAFSSIVPHFTSVVDDPDPGRTRVILLLVNMWIFISLEMDQNSTRASMLLNSVKEFIKPPYLFILQVLSRVPVEAEACWSSLNNHERSKLNTFMIRIKAVTVELLQKLAETCRQSTKDLNPLLQKQQIAGAHCLGKVLLYLTEITDSVYSR